MELLEALGSGVELGCLEAARRDAESAPGLPALVASSPENGDARAFSSSFR
jgi:hypothetical protein